MAHKLGSGNVVVDALEESRIVSPRKVLSDYVSGSSYRRRKSRTNRSMTSSSGKITEAVFPQRGA